MERYGNDERQLIRRAQQGDFNYIQEIVSEGDSRCAQIAEDKNDESLDAEERENAARREQICKDEVDRAANELKELPDNVKQAIKKQYDDAQNAPAYDGIEPLPRSAREIYQQPDAISVLSGQLAYRDLGIGIEAMLNEDGLYPNVKEKRLSVFDCIFEKSFRWETCLKNKNGTSGTGCGAASATPPRLFSRRSTPTETESFAAPSSAGSRTRSGTSSA